PDYARPTVSFVLYLLRPLPISTLFPYPTLFRSVLAATVSAVLGFVILFGLLASNPEERAVNVHLFSWIPAGDHENRCTLTARSSDRKSTRLNSSHVKISYAVFCLKKKKRNTNEY